MPYELEIAAGWLDAAVSTAWPRSSMLGESASTSRMRQSGQAEETASRSSAVSMDQLGLFGGRLWPPFWSSLVKQPLAVVHGPRP